MVRFCLQNKLCMDFFSSSFPRGAVVFPFSQDTWWHFIPLRLPDCGLNLAENMDSSLPYSEAGGFLKNML